MRGMKIVPQDFALKMQGGLMREGSGTLRYWYIERVTSRKQKNRFGSRCEG